MRLGQCAKPAWSRSSQTHRGDRMDDDVDPIARAYELLAKGEEQDWAHIQWQQARREREQERALGATQHRGAPPSTLLQQSPRITNPFPLISARFRRPTHLGHA